MKKNITQEQEKILKQHGININLTLEMLNYVNQTKKSSLNQDWKIPNIENDPNIININAPIQVSLERINQLKKEFPELNDHYLPLKESYSSQELEKLGYALMPYFGFGILNGGSATSYLDKKSNEKISTELYNLYQEEFKTIREKYLNYPKGLTPSFFTENKEEGATFLELKLRSILLNSQKISKDHPRRKPIQLFQMTNTSTHDLIIKTLEDYKKNSPYIKPLLNEEFKNYNTSLAEKQPLIAALTHSKEGSPYQIFFDEENNPISLPGGHGQSFITLKPIFEKLYKEGYRYISIGNIDNVGYTPNPIALAILVLNDSKGLFFFSHKTEVDIKGGVLFTNPQNQFTCLDIGGAVSFDYIKEQEELNKSILFNCAIGYFDLEYLLSLTQTITESLPIRVSDQHKARGYYSQMEQIAWEIIPLLEKTTILTVEKKEHFLANKLLLENFINCSYKIEEYPTSCQNLKKLSLQLSHGLRNILKNEYSIDKLE